MGFADVLTVLVSDYLTFYAQDPSWKNRDRLILSPGHGSALLYSMLYLTSYPGITIEDLKSFRKMGSKCTGHPELGVIPGIEMTTGPLGQGFASGVGMALAERHKSENYGADFVDHYTYVIASDGDLMEGVVAEAASLAGT